MELCESEGWRMSRLTSASQCVAALAGSRCDLCTLPVSRSQGSQFEFPRLGLRRVAEDSLKLCLKLAGQEVAPPSVQPHLEETALVVHEQVLSVSEVLHNIWRRGGESYESRKHSQL